MFTTIQETFDAWYVLTKLKQRSFYKPRSVIYPGNTISAASQRKQAYINHRKESTLEDS